MKRAKVAQASTIRNCVTTPGAASPAAAGNRGLRHFSMKVCEQVQKRGKTTYNEVADELVNEFSERGSGGSSAGGAAGSAASANGAGYDQKNIRRRVYDALNVLMAMGESFSLSSLSPPYEWDHERRYGDGPSPRLV